MYLKYLLSLNHMYRTKALEKPNKVVHACDPLPDRWKQGQEKKPIWTTKASTRSGLSSPLHCCGPELEPPQCEARLYHEAHPLPRNHLYCYAHAYIYIKALLKHCTSLTPIFHDASKVQSALQL